MKATKFSQYLQHREELQFVDRPHWIYVVEAGIWATLIILGGFWIHNWLGINFITPNLNAADNASATMPNGLTQGVNLSSLTLTITAYVALFVKWGGLLYATFYFINRVIFYLSTFVFASDRRLYYKTGMIRVQVFEIAFEEIRKTDINYGWLGRFLGYGKLMLDARFVEDEDLPFLHKPETFGKLIHYNNDLSQDINLSMVTGEIRKKQGRREKIVTTAEVHDEIDPMHDQMDSIHYQYPTERGATERTQKKHEEEMEQTLQHDFDEATEKEHESGEDYKKPVRTSSSFMK